MALSTTTPKMRDGAPVRPLRVDLPRPTNPLAPQLLGDLEVARRLSISPATVKGLRLDGRLPFVRIGKLARVSERDLAAFIERQRVGGA